MKKWALAIAFPLFSLFPLHAQAVPQRTVILPFENLSAQTEDQWLGKSFAENLTQGLSQLQALEILERSQIQALFKEQNFGQSLQVNEQSAPQLGQMLGAKWILIGSYQRQGQQLLINARFVNVETGKVDPALSVQLQGPVNQLFLLQSQLATALAEKLKIVTSERERVALAARFQQTTSTEAHSLYLQAQEASAASDARKAYGLYQKALILDPVYVPAVLGQADNLVNHAILSQRFQMNLLDLSPEQALQAAGQLFQSLSSTEQESLQGRSLQALLFYAGGDKPQALQVLQAAAKAHGDRPELILLFFQLYSDFGTGLSAENAGKILALLQPYIKDNPRLKYELATQALHNLGMGVELAQIRLWLEEVAQAWPQNPEVYLSLSEVYQRMEESEKSASSLQKALALGPDTPYLRLAVAQKQFLAQNPEAAMQSVQTLLGKHPNFVLGHYLLCSLYLQLEQPAAARSSAETMVRLAPRFGLGWYLFGLLLNTSSDYPASNQALDQALSLLLPEQDADSIWRAWRLKAINQQEMHQLASSRESLLQAVQTAPEPDLKASLYLQLANSYYLGSDPEIEKTSPQREAWLKQALTLVQAPALRAQLYRELANEYHLYQQKPAEAVLLYEKALALARHESERLKLRVELADARLTAGQAAEAEAEWFKLLETQEAPEAHRKLAMLYSGQNQWAKSLSHYSQFLKSSPEVAQNAFHQSTYRYYYLHAELEKTPNKPELLNDLGQYHLQIDDPEGALIYLQAAAAQLQTHPVVQYNLGLALLQLKRWPEAAKSFEKALELRSDYVEAWFNLGFCLREQGQKDPARRAWLKARELRPDFPGLQAALEGL